jgi:hypothetical protein
MPASRRVFHAPLTGRKTGDTGPNSEMSAQGALAHLASGFRQMAAWSGMGRQMAAQE